MKKLLAILFFLPALAFAQKTMNEARPDIRLLLSSTNTETRFYTDAQVDTAWARAIRIVALKAEVVVQKSDSFVTVAGTYRYLLASTMNRLRVVWKGAGVNRKLLFITNDPYISVRAGADLPAEHGYLHAGASGFELKIFPTPTAVESVYYDYYARPVVPTAAGNATDILPELLPALVYEAAAWLINADYKQSVAAQYHAIAMDMAITYRNSFLTQGNMMPSAGGK